MRSMLVSLASLVLVMLVGLFVVSCKVTPDQGKVIAEGAGMFSAVTWMSIENPPPEAVVSVVAILDVIRQNATNIESGKTYSEIIYPEVEKFIDSDKVPAKYKSICKVASLTILGGIDTLFSEHPDWKLKQDYALDIVNCFITGAEKGLKIENLATKSAITRARSM